MNSTKTDQKVTYNTKTLDELRKNENDPYAILKSVSLIERKRAESEDDFENNNKKSLNERDEEYTKIIKTFRNIYKKRQSNKEKWKKWFFWIVIVIFMIYILAILLLLMLMISKIGKVDVASLITTVITGCSSIVASLIILPQTIAKYLFDPKEDDNISKMVVQMQNKDMDNKHLLYSMKNKQKEDIE